MVNETANVDLELDIQPSKEPIYVSTNTDLQLDIQGTYNIPINKLSNTGLEIGLYGSYNMPINKLSNVDLQLGLYGTYNVYRPYNGNVDLGTSIYSGEYTIQDFTPPPDIRLYGSFVKYKELETTYKKLQSLSARYSKVIEMELDG